MLVKYDAKVQRWIATVTIDGSPCVIVSHSMLRAMQLAAWLVCAPPAGELVQRELSQIPDTSEVYTQAALWRAGRNQKT